MSVAMWNCHSWPLDVTSNVNHLIVSNGLSLHTLSANQWPALTGSFKLGGPLSDCFKWALTTNMYHIISDLMYMTVSNGGTSAKEGSSAKFELISGLTLASQRSFLWKTNKCLLSYTVHHWILKWAHNNCYLNSIVSTMRIHVLHYIFLVKIKMLFNSGSLKPL